MSEKVIVGFVSQKGGVGKSTLARALAAVVAYSGLRVRIADLDRYQETILEWARRRESMPDVPPIGAEAFDTATEAIASARDGELLIVDAPAHASRATLDIAKAATLVVQPTSGSHDDLRPAVLLFHELTKAGIPKERLVIALCRVLSQAEEDMARSYLAKAGYDVLPGCIAERSRFRQAHDRGQAVTEANDKAQTARTDQLIASLLRRVKVALETSEKKSKTARRSGKKAS